MLIDGIAAVITTAFVITAVILRASCGKRGSLWEILNDEGEEEAERYPSLPDIR